MRCPKHLAGLLSLSLLAACQQSSTPAPVYDGSAGTPRPQPASPLSGGPPGVLETAGGRTTVQQGETLYAISRRSGVPVRSLIDANNLQPPYRVQAGQVLTVPRTRQHIVQQGDTLYSVARTFGVEAASLARINHLDPPYTVKLGQPLVLPPQVASVPQGAAAPTSALSPPGVVPSPVAAPQPGAVGPITTTALSPPAGTPPPQPSATGAPQVLAPPATQAPAQAATPPIPPPIPPRPAPAPAPIPAPADNAEDEAPPAAAAGKMSPPEPESAPATQAPAAAAAPSAAVASLVESHRAPTAPLFTWPVSGRIISTFGPAAGGTHNDGINIAAPEGTTVAAAEGGTIAYAGNELRGFGNLLLIKHDGGWVTAYAHNQVLLVKKGDHVRRGQAIARVGSTGGVNGAQLHFELRNGTKAIDPLDHLPQLTAGN
jgi:murein DD-endopeptidase MepM/ murein hydrolase activator NlpD